MDDKEDDDAIHHENSLFSMISGQRSQCLRRSFKMSNVILYMNLYYHIIMKLKPTKRFLLIF